MQTEEIAVLVKRMQAGDSAAFDEIFAAYSKTAVRTAALISGEKSLAEDIAQEAFVLCIIHIGELKNPLAFRSWFFRILTRCAWKISDQRMQTSEWNDKALPSCTDTYPSNGDMQNEELYMALNKLSRKQRAAVVLYYFNELSIREIAQATACPEATVKTRLFAARQRMRRTLERKEKQQ